MVSAAATSRVLTLVMGTVVVVAVSISAGGRVGAMVLAVVVVVGMTLLGVASGGRRRRGTVVRRVSAAVRVVLLVSSVSSRSVAVVMTLHGSLERPLTSSGVLTSPRNDLDLQLSLRLVKT